MLLECVPNFSAGRDPAVGAALRSALGSVPGALLLDWHSDPDHNRAVATLVGEEEALLEAVFAGVATATERIDLNRHEGVHPRLGATDVCPFVPFPQGDLELCARLAHALGARVGRELRVPVLYYGAAALRPERRELPAVRGRGFEALRAALEGGRGLEPDAGPPALHPRAGAIAIGARGVLVAFNVQLDTRDVGVARAIASAIRSSGGGLPGIRALGFLLAQRGCAQVSINVCEPARTGLRAVFEAVERLAHKVGVGVVDSELVGLAPRAALDGEIARAVKLAGFDPRRQVLEEALAARGLG